MKLALTQVTVKVKALSGPVRPKKKPKKKRTQEISYDTSDSESEGAERVSTPKKNPKKKITHETSPETGDSESKGTERATTSQKKPKKKRTHETSYDISDSESECAERASTPKKKPKKKRKGQRRKARMKLALTQLTVRVKVLSRLLNPKKGQKKHQKLGTGLRESITKRRTCPICHKSVTVIRRHIKIHVQKMKRYPWHEQMVMIQMAYHGNKTRGPKRKEGKGKGRKIFRGRPKEICPLCDRVQLYLTTHLQRYHKLARDFSAYEKNSQEI